MLAHNAAIDPTGMAQQYAVCFKKQLKNVDRDVYSSEEPIPVRINSRPVSGGTVPSSSAAAQPVSLATFRSLMDQLNTQIKEMKAIQDKVWPVDVAVDDTGRILVACQTISPACVCMLTSQWVAAISMATKGNFTPHLLHKLMMHT